MALSLRPDHVASTVSCPSFQARLLLVGCRSTTRNSDTLLRVGSTTVDHGQHSSTIRYRAPEETCAVRSLATVNPPLDCDLIQFQILWENSMSKILYLTSFVLTALSLAVVNPTVAQTSDSDTPVAAVAGDKAAKCCQQSEDCPNGVCPMPPTALVVTCTKPCCAETVVCTKPCCATTASCTKPCCATSVACDKPCCAETAACTKPCCATTASCTKPCCATSVACDKPCCAETAACTKPCCATTASCTKPCCATSVACDKPCCKAEAVCEKECCKVSA